MFVLHKSHYVAIYSTDLFFSLHLDSDKPSGKSVRGELSTTILDQFLVQLAVCLEKRG